MTTSAKVTTLETLDELSSFQLSCAGNRQTFALFFIADTKVEHIYALLEVLFGAFDEDVRLMKYAQEDFTVRLTQIIS